MTRITRSVSRIRAIVFVAAVAVGLLTGPGQAAGPGYVTLLMGRTQWVQTNSSCEPRQNAVPLDRVAVDLHARGLSATGAVVINRTMETTRFCWHGWTLHPSWQDLAVLRDEYGWSFVSAGQSYANMTLLTPEEQWNESCGSLSALTSRSHSRAWGLFAYPANKSTATVQREVVATCFAYGRKYDLIRNLRSSTVDPWFQKTRSVNGGKCHDPALPCYNMRVRNDRRYTPPTTLRSLVNVGPDEWASVQWYRLVEGKSSGDTAFEWDCTSVDWRKHWTGHPELYCYSDFLSVVDAIPDAAVVVDPATVAEAWGRTP